MTENNYSISELKEKLTKGTSEMVNHSLFSELKTLEDLRKFMEWHVFAVWDFMSLVKRLQHEFTCVTIPWNPAKNKSASRLLNEIVLGEESDDDIAGSHASHFELYISAMREIGADTSQIEKFIELTSAAIPVELALNMVKAHDGIKKFVLFTINTAQSEKPIKVLGSFLFGREDAIPQMFKSLLSSCSISENEVPTFVYYLQRHIELDGDSHGPAANRLAVDMAQQDEKKWLELYYSGLKAVMERNSFWSCLEQEIINCREVENV